MEPTLIALSKQKAPQDMGAKTHNKALKREQLQWVLWPFVTYFANYHLSLIGAVGLKEYQNYLTYTACFTNKKPI